MRPYSRPKLSLIPDHNTQDSTPPTRRSALPPPKNMTLRGVQGKALSLLGRRFGGGAKPFLQGSETHNLK
jgi:hypothetical protein